MRVIGIVAFAALAGCAHDVVKQCDSPGHACTWLGIAGEEGFNGDGHVRLETKIYWAMDMKFAADGTPWLIDWNNHLVRKVMPDQTVHTVVGWTDPIFPGDGAPAETTNPDGAIGTDVQLNHPTDFAELPDGTMLLMAWHNHKLRHIDPPSGNVKIVCGKGGGFAGDGGPATGALFKQPKSVEVDDAGQIYILDQGNLRVRRIDTAGVITTVVGNGMKGFAGDNGPATMAQLAWDTGSNPEPTGGLALAGGKLYISDTLNQRIRVVDLTSMVITTLAGTGDKGYSGDGGPAASAVLNGPRDMEIGPDGRLYFADTDNNVIRAIDLSSGTIDTVAGNGTLGLDPDDDRLALDTTLKRPFGIEFDKTGNLYIADTINSRFLRVAK